ncbi:MAG: lysophospholipase [Devosiaceae bacterium]|nr:lysophospholipase [Devosiaceae bacterium]
MIKKTLWGIVFLISIYVGLIMYINKNQRNMQYEPGSTAIALSEVEVARAEFVVISTGFLDVHGWYAPPIGDKPIIIYFKGNEGSFSEEYERFAQISKDGYGVLAYDYRGFPMSPGKINQENILNDALAVFDWIAEKNSNIVLFGRSLGSGPATYVASKRDATALILEAPFISAAEVAKKRFP